MANIHNTLSSLFDDCANKLYDFKKIGVTANLLPNSEFYIAYGNDKFVAVGSSKGKFYSSDGLVWTPCSTTTSLNCVTYGNGKFVGVGNSGVGAYSEDGITWTEVSLPQLTNFYLVVFVNNTFIAMTSSSQHMSSSNVVLASDDGITWNFVSSLQLPSSIIWTDIAYGNDKLVAVGQNNIAYRTGDSWGVYNSSSLGILKSVTYGNDKFVAVGSKKTPFYSTDGITWQPSNNLPLSSAALVFYADGKFYACGTSGVATSTDGVTWTATSIPVNTLPYSAIYAKGRFIIITSNSNVYSVNGVDWEVVGRNSSLVSNEWQADVFPSILQNIYIQYTHTVGKNFKWTVETDVVANKVLWGEMAYSNGRFLVVSQSHADGPAAYSDDGGITWTQYNSTNLAGKYGQLVTDDQGRFFYTGGGINYYFISNNGINWQQHYFRGDATQWLGFAYGEGKYIAASRYKSGSGPTNIANYSEDGINWNETTLPLKKEWERAVFGKGMFILIVQGGLTYSYDGIIWSDFISVPFGKNSKLAYGGDIFVVVDVDGSVHYSTDGINWGRTSLPGRYLAVTYGDGYFVITSESSGLSWWSTNGVDWFVIPEGIDSHAVAYGDGKFVCFGTRYRAENGAKAAHFSI